MASFSQGEASILKYEDKVSPYSMIGWAEEANYLQRFNRALQKSQVFPWLCAGMGWEASVTLQKPHVTVRITSKFNVLRDSRPGQVSCSHT